MKKRSLFWISILCITFFLMGFGSGKVFSFQKVVVSSTDQPQSSLTFAIPKISLPSDWETKTNLPGNSFDTAFPLSTGIKTQGTLNPSNAIDYYTFDLQNSSQIVINVTDVPKALFWVLYDSQKKEIASTYRTGSMGGSTQISLNNPGKYYIKVWADYHELVNYPYTISLNILPYFE